MKHGYRTIAALLCAFCLSSCFTWQEMQAFLGFQPILGYPYLGTSANGSLKVDGVGPARMVQSVGVAHHSGHVAYTAGFDFGGFGQNQVVQGNLRLSKEYTDAGVKLLDGEINPDGDYLGVGTGGSIFSFNREDCFVPIDSGTTEDINTVTSFGNHWFLGGNNGFAAYGEDPENLQTLSLSGFGDGANLRTSRAFSKGVLFMADHVIVECIPGPGGNVSLGYGIGIDKVFKAVTPWGDWYLALAVDTLGGGSVILIRTDDSFQYAPQFAPIYSRKYCNIMAHGDRVYLVPYDAEGNSTRTIEIWNFADGAFIGEKDLPITVEEYFFIGDEVYIAGPTRLGEYQVWRSDLEFSELTSVSEAVLDKLIRTAFCIRVNGTATWRTYGTDCDLIKPGIQFAYYDDSRIRTGTIAGSTGTGSIFDTVALNDGFYLGAGFEGSEPRLITDTGHESRVVPANGLEGSLTGLSFNSRTGICLATNLSGEAYLADLSDVDEPEDFADVVWGKLSSSYRFDPEINTPTYAGFALKIAEDEDTEFDLGIIDASGSFSYRDLAHIDKKTLNDCYYDPFNRWTLLGGTSGIFYLADEGDEGRLPIELGGTPNFECHKLQGDGLGDWLMAVTGTPGADDGICPIYKLRFRGMRTMNPSMELVSYTTPDREPSLIYSQGFFALLGNRGLVSLCARYFDSWPDFSEYYYGDRNVDPLGDFDNNGIDNFYQAIAGERGLSARIEAWENHARASVSLSPYLLNYRVWPKCGDHPAALENFNGPLYFNPAVGLNMTDELYDRRFYSFEIEPELGF